jgi:small subunit ribosomal protein S14
MVKLAVEERQKRRKRIINKYREKREKLLEELKQCFKNNENPEAIYRRIREKQPRDASKTRSKNFCAICGRQRSVYRRFHICRLCLFKYAMIGYIPGLRKASW